MPHIFLLNFLVIKFFLKTMYFFVIYELIIHVYLLQKKGISLKKKNMLLQFWYIFMRVFLATRIRILFFPKWIRIRPNEGDPVGSGSETL